MNVRPCQLELGREPLQARMSSCLRGPAELGLCCIRQDLGRELSVDGWR